MVELRAADPTAPRFDEPLPWEWLGAMDADLHVTVSRARWDATRLHDAKLVVRVDDRRLEASLDGFAQGGPTTGRLVADARSQPPTLAVRSEITDAHISEYVEGGNATGAFEGRVDLTGSGTTPREILEKSTGVLAVGVGSGVIGAAPFGSLGEDLFEIFVSQLDRNRARTVNCAALHVELENGVGPVRVVFDIDESTIGGGGIVDLPGWRTDVVLRPNPKRPTVGAFRTPIRVSGRFGALTARLDAAAMVRQTGQVVLLGVLSPWLIVVPFVDLGTQKANPCAEALANAPEAPEQQKGLILRGIDGTLGAGEWIRDHLAPEEKR